MYIYILIYKDVDGSKTVCKADIDLNRITRYGCSESNKHPERSYMIFRQPVTYNGTGKLSLYINIDPSDTHVN